MRLSYDQRELLLDARKGLVQQGEVTFHECARRLHRAIPTAAHAGRLVEAMLVLLGDRGRLDPYTDGRKAMVLRADPEGWWLRRSPAALYDGGEWNECDQASEIPMNARPADAPPGWTFGDPAFRPADPEPDIAPAGLGRAVLTLWAGAAVVEVRYGDTGLAEPDRALYRFGDRWAERRFAGLWPPTVDPAARPTQAQPPAWFVDFPDDPPSIEALAERILAADAALDPVRVRMHVDAPGGVEGCWFRARMALRKLAMDEKLPTAGGVYLLDAYEHPPEDTCLAIGRDPAEAEAAWVAEERRLRPKPVRRHDEPEPDDEPEPSGPSETETVDAAGKKVLTLSTGTLRLSIAPVTVIPWPIPGPRTTPVVAIRVPPLPTEIPEAWRAEGFSRWRYLVGDSGRIGFALVRDEADGFTQVGDGILDAVDPRGLEQALDAGTAAEGDFPFPEPPWLSYPYEHRHYAVWNELLQEPMPPTPAGASWNEEWNWRDMEGDVYRWRVTRMRYRGT